MAFIIIIQYYYTIIIQLFTHSSSLGRDAFVLGLPAATKSVQACSSLPLDPPANNTPEPAQGLQAGNSYCIYIFVTYAI
jgi:hypothetical protein